MLPARWMRYDLLPKNDNGKIDRPRLKEAFLAAESRQAQAEAPRPATQREGIAGIGARGVGANLAGTE
jgi:hypothetical protein